MFSNRILILSLLLLKNSNWRVWWGRQMKKLKTIKKLKNICLQHSLQKFPKLLFTGRHQTEISTILKNIEHWLLTIPGNNSVDFEEIDNGVNSMMEKSQNRTASGHQFADICKVCGKEGHVRDIRNHIEANHLEGVVIPYNLCDKTFRSRNSFRTHKSRQHTNKFACSQNWFKFKLLKPLWWSFWVQKCFETS